MEKKFLNYYVPSYQVFIQKRLLLESRKSIQKYQIKIFDCFFDTACFGISLYSQIAEYLVELSKKGYIRLKNIILDREGISKLSVYIQRAENPIRILGIGFGSSPPIRDCSREKIIVDRAIKNKHLTYEDFLILLNSRNNFYDYISFTLDFIEIKTLEEELNEYIEYFRKGDLIVPPSDDREYYSYQISAELIKGCLSRKWELQGTDNLRISMGDVYKIKPEFETPKGEHPVFSVKFLETFLAMEKEDKLEILEMEADKVLARLKDASLIQKDSRERQPEWQRKEQTDDKASIVKGKTRNIEVDRKRGSVLINGREILKFKKSLLPYEIFETAYSNPNKTISINDERFKKVPEILGVVNNLNKRFRRKNIPIELQKITKDKFKLIINE